MNSINSIFLCESLRKFSIVSYLDDIIYEYYSFTVNFHLIKQLSYFEKSLENYLLYFDYSDIKDTFLS